MSENQENLDDSIPESNANEEVAASAGASVINLQAKLDDLEHDVKKLKKAGSQREEMLKAVLYDLSRLEKTVSSLFMKELNGSPNDDCEIYNKFQVYVGNVDIETSENDLREHFQKFGEVIDVLILKKHLLTQCGLVEFSKPEMAEAALNIRPHIVNGRRLIVSKAVNKQSFRKYLQVGAPATSSSGPKSPKSMTFTRRYNPY